jgi:hypothetical protein
MNGRVIETTQEQFLGFLVIQSDPEVSMQFA